MVYFGWVMVEGVGYCWLVFIGGLEEVLDVSVEVVV